MPVLSISHFPQQAHMLSIVLYDLDRLLALRICHDGEDSDSMFELESRETQQQEQGEEEKAELEKGDSKR